MPHYRKLPGMASKAIGVADVPPEREVTVTIAGVGSEKFDKDERGVIRVSGSDRFLPLNRGNGARIAAMFGPDTEGWTGKRITVAVDATVTFGGERTGGIIVVGSPDLAASVQISIKQSRTKRRTETLRRTIAGEATPGHANEEGA
jgi:hypothetical protein